MRLRAALASRARAVADAMDRDSETWTDAGQALRWNRRSAVRFRHTDALARFLEAALAKLPPPAVLEVNGLRVSDPAGVESIVDSVAHDSDLARKSLVISGVSGAVAPWVLHMIAPGEGERTGATFLTVLAPWGEAAEAARIVRDLVDEHCTAFTRQQVRKGFALISPVSFEGVEQRAHDREVALSGAIRGGVWGAVAGAVAGLLMSLLLSAVQGDGAEAEPPATSSSLSNASVTGVARLRHAGSLLPGS